MASSCSSVNEPVLILDLQELEVYRLQQLRLKKVVIKFSVECRINYTRHREIFHERSQTTLTHCNNT